MEGETSVGTNFFAPFVSGCFLWYADAQNDPACWSKLLKVFLIGHCRQEVMAEQED
jgi:hypothetical protein